jgi:outer membrane immunogenic protein
VVGAGIEYGFTPNWTAKLEYDHIALDDVTRGGVLVNDSVTLSRRFDMLTFGLNFKF